MSRDVTWGLYIAQFTFLVGVAASAVMVVLPYYLHNYKAFGKMVILGEFLAVSAVLMCMLFIFVDLGQPRAVHERAAAPDAQLAHVLGHVMVLIGLPAAEPGDRLRDLRRRTQRGAAAQVGQAVDLPVDPLGRSASTRSRRSSIRAWQPGRSG